MHRTATTDGPELSPVPFATANFAAPLPAADAIRIESREGRMTVRATKRVEARDPYQSGHFPELVIYPGVFVLETLRQATAAALGERQGVFPDVAEVLSVRFLAPVLGGDSLEVEATVGPLTPSGWFEVYARCRRGDGTVAALAKVRFRYGSA